MEHFLLESALNNEYNRFTADVVNLQSLSKKLDGSGLDPIQISEIKSNLAKLGVVLLHASLEQYFKWLLAIKLGFNSIEESANLMGQLQFLKPNTLPSYRAGKGQYSIQSIFNIYSVQTSKQDDQRSTLSKLALTFNRVQVNTPLNFDEVADRYNTFIDLRHQIAHESDLTTDVTLEMLEQFYISCKVMFVYYVGFLLFQCQFSKDFSNW